MGNQKMIPGSFTCFNCLQKFAEIGTVIRRERMFDQLYCCHICYSDIYLYEVQDSSKYEDQKSTFSCCDIDMAGPNRIYMKVTDETTCPKCGRRPLIEKVWHTRLLEDIPLEIDLQRR